MTCYLVGKKEKQGSKGWQPKRRKPDWKQGNPSQKRKAGFLGTQSLSGVWGVPTNPLFIGGGAGMKTGKLAKKKT